MANLDDIQIFVKVAQFESISRAAARWDADLGGEPAVVGARIEARRFRAGDARRNLTARDVSTSIMPRVRIVSSVPHFADSVSVWWAREAPCLRRGQILLSNILTNIILLHSTL